MLPDNSVIQYRYDAEGIRVKKVEDGSEVRYLMDGLSGQIHTESGSLNQPYQYVGGEGYYTEPDINLQLLGQRWYDAEVGRFISRDPIGEEGGLNLYGYVGNNPVNEIDPYGLLFPVPIPFPIPIPFGWGSIIGLLERWIINPPPECEGPEVVLFNHCFVSCVSAKLLDPSGIISSELPAFLIKILPKRWKEWVNKNGDLEHLIGMK